MSDYLFAFFSFTASLLVAIITAFITSYLTNRRENRFPNRELETLKSIATLMDYKEYDPITAIACESYKQKAARKYGARLQQKYLRRRAIGLTLAGVFCLIYAYFFVDYSYASGIFDAFGETGGWLAILIPFLVFVLMGAFFLLMGIEGFISLIAARIRDITTHRRLKGIYEVLQKMSENEVESAAVECISKASEVLLVAGVYIPGTIGKKPETRQEYYQKYCRDLAHFKLYRPDLPKSISIAEGLELEFKQHSELPNNW